MYDERVLPQTGSVLGIDVGYSETRKTTAFCGLSWTRHSIDWLFASARADSSSREDALIAVRSGKESEFIAVAIDGPLRPRLQVLSAYRTAECLLSRGAFQKRGKPGQTSSKNGRELHDHATRLAKMVLADYSDDIHPRPFSATAGVYEAFPNLFLGVLCDVGRYPVRPKHRRWTDCLFPLVATKLEKLIQSLLPDRSIAKPLSSETDHEQVAALACAITALAAAGGECVAVGSRIDGYIVLPPLSRWGDSDKGERWAERELRNNVRDLSSKTAVVHPPEIYAVLQLRDYGP